MIDECSCAEWIVVFENLLFPLFAGTCITFLIIIGDQFDRAFASLVGPDFCHTWYLNRSAKAQAASEDKGSRGTEMEGINSRLLRLEFLPGFLPSFFRSTKCIHE
jgi:hypothetical protein